MKITIILSILVVFGMIGYMYKNKLNQEYLFLKYLYDFVYYFDSNITLFKNNSIEIINKYIIAHKNKNAVFNNIFIKNNNLIQFNGEILKKYIIDNEFANTIKLYLETMGKSYYEYEIDKNKKFIILLNTKINESYENIKIKGDLFFKIMLAIGAVLAVLVW